jgi:predicted nucleic acid-binding protein
MIQRVYIDTSVIGGCFDSEFSEWSNRLFDEFKEGKRIAVISDITIDELTDAPEVVQENFETIPDKSLEVLISDIESNALAEKYLMEKVITARYFEDALHIAIATLHQVTVLASWNFKHIVNLEKIRGYNSVNLKYGYPMIEIRTPREILKFDEDENY